MFILLLEKEEFIKYAISGTINTLITLTIYNVLIRIGVNYMVSNVIGYFIGIVSGFILDKVWVFKSDKKVFNLFAKFIIVNITSIVFSSIILFTLVNYICIDNILAQLIATISTGIFNYTMNKLWTFS
ncbi:GtrA family protein [Clostridium sp. WILCCON 0269]|uniref:GtrA family protein n=1 Tax=Candidatus Clostridium eludens TaxID=3381663 RepID=A0ABW8SG54_9CLOT